MTISFSQQWGLLYILVDLCMVMSFLINKKIDDGVFRLVPKEFAMGLFGRQIGLTYSSTQVSQ